MLREYATVSEGRLAADEATWGFCRYLKRHLNVSLMEARCLRDDRDDELPVDGICAFDWLGVDKAVGA